MIRIVFSAILLLLASARAHAVTLSNIAYKTRAPQNDYETERCVLDLYLPTNRTGFATLVWFHGGGLTAGSKNDKETRAIAQSLARGGLGVVVPNYRLSPKATYPAYIEDAAAAVAWTHTHIAQHGGEPTRLFIGGHSAGGYLTLMLGLDAHYLKDAGVPSSAVAGLIPVSGQTMTHYTVRAERGIRSRFTVIADEAAPVYHTRKNAPPMLVLWAENDMPARAEENAYLVALLKGIGHTRVTGRMIANRDHGSVGHRIADDNDSARLAILEFIHSTTGTQP